jgi:dolichyl-phosphate beta-glucosyltransferase
MLISFIVPIYNEEKRIEHTIQKIAVFRKREGHTTELIFVFDGSTDQTKALAGRALENMPHRWMDLECNRGKGKAVQEGMLAAQGEFLFFTDADLSTPLEEYERLLGALQDGYGLAIGSRGMPDSRVVVHQNWLRESMGIVFNRIARFFSFKDIHDSQCGFKAFRKEAARKLFGLQRIDGFSFDAEIIYLAQQLGLKIAEVGVTWKNSKESRVKMVRDSFRMLIDLLRIRWLHRDLKSRRTLHD